jgi:hypothetical protein
MTRHELIQSLSAADLYPIPVEGDIDAERIRGLSFLGDLNGFIQAAKALNVRCVFIASRVMEESDFFYHEDPAKLSYAATRQRTLPTGPIDLGDNIDLREIDPSLNEFKAHLGDECGFKLTVHSSTTILQYVLLLEWWQEFSELRERAIEKILQELELAESKQMEEEERRTQRILDSVRELINDPDFVRLPTQRAMQAYAFERIAGLDTINPNILKVEIQSLDAKIKARGLGRKK